MKDLRYDEDPEHDENEVECKHCGVSGLHWEELDTGKWALMTESYKVHKCDPRRLDKATAGDFDNLTK